MAKLAQAEAERYSDVWESLERYSTFSPGESYLPIFQEVATPPATVLDAGCGSGKGMIALANAGFEVIGCDLTGAGILAEAARFPFREACLWRPLRPQLRHGQVDWVYCTDVMEHLPTQFTMLAVTELLAMATQGVFFSIALGVDQAGDWLGYGNLHQTVQPFTWWRDSLAEIGRVEQARDLITVGIFVVRSR